MDQNSKIAYFQKANVSNGIVINGATVPFEPVGNNWGVIALDTGNPSNNHFLEGLNDFCAKGVGGVGKISAEEYAQKKSLPVSEPLGRPKDWLRQRPSGPPRRQAQPPAEAIPVADARPASPAPVLVEAPLDLDSLKPASDLEAEAKEDAFRPPTRRIARKKTIEPAIT